MTMAVNTNHDSLRQQLPGWAPLVVLAGAWAEIVLPILIVQDVVSVWSFRHTWDGWIIGWMLPGAAAFATLTERATSASVDIVPLHPEQGDFNSDLCAMQPARFAERLAPQMRDEDAQNFLRR